MNKIKFDSNLIKLMILFESRTGAKVKDCIANKKLIFVVEESEMGKAIGKNGINIKKMEHELRRRIKLVEYSSDVLQFIKNIIYPIEAPIIEEVNGTIIIHGKDSSTKSLLVGRERQNINHLTALVKRYFKINEIRVV
ncbi:MAG: NusA-like transcription termination signal-binding factor [Nanoarchaeota archaeon]